MFARMLERFRGGRDILAADYVAALRALDATRAAWRAATAAYDAVLLPTTANLPPKVERLSPRPTTSPPRTCSRSATPASPTSSACPR